MAATDAATSGNDDASGDGTTSVDALPEREIGLDVATVELDGPCFARADDERLASVGPEGDLWLVRDDADGTTVRSLAPDVDELAFTLPWPVEAAQAWDRDRGTVLADGGLWSIDAAYAEPIRWPDDVASPFASCGDPSRDGDAFVLAGDLFSRDVGQWWSWNLPGEALAGDEHIATSAGACSGDDGRAFILRGDEVWTIESDWIAPRPELGPATALAADVGVGAAAIVDDALNVLHEDDTAERLVFAAGAVHDVLAAPDTLWVRAGDRLYTATDDAWLEVVDSDGSIANDIVGADDRGGIWIERAGEVCYRGPQASIRLDGVRPYERRRTSALDVTLTSDEAPTVLLDGTAIDVVATEDAFAISAIIEDEGWHTLDVSAGAAHRRVAFAVEGIVPATWSDDIEPLFMAHCSGDACHGPDPTGDERPDLSTHATWVDSTDAILDRVVTTGDMPPPGANELSIDDVLLLVGWIEAGLPENEED